MGNKHKHADLIKAWADGAEIQVRLSNMVWCDIDENPAWDKDSLYRIKPEEKKPVVRWLWADKYGYFPMRMLAESEVENFDGKLTKLEWSRTEFPE